MNRSGWLTVLGSFLAATTSSGVILTMTFSVFVKPIGDEFGWSRAFVSLGYTAALISIALFLPFIGRLLDRFGVRSVLLWFVMLFSLSIVFLSITPNVPVIFVALYAVVGALEEGRVQMRAAVQCALIAEGPHEFDQAPTRAQRTCS